MKIHDVFVLVTAILLGFAVGWYLPHGAGSGGDARDTLLVKVDSFTDTVYVEVHDSVPIVKMERVVCYVPVDCVQVCTAHGHDDSVAVVQREYSDDSTYTAWVSGVRYDVWPKLDSISVRQREITKTVHETVTLVERKKSSRFSVGLTGGYGYGLGYRGFEPFLGLGVSYRIFPP